jgi:hypothetical protein
MMAVVGRSLAIVAALLPGVVAAQTYSVTDFGTLGGSAAVANGINDGV